MNREHVQPRRKQDRNYWDRMAARWDHEIFNTLHHDKFRVIPDELRRSSRGAQSVADFGCGVGVYLPLLGRLFGTVHGFERSAACVSIARAGVRHLSHVAVHAASTASVKRRGTFDVVLCVNVAIHPSRHQRATVLRAVRALLAPGGTMILVVPSFESAAMVAAAEREALRRRSARSAGDWDADGDSDGVVRIEGLPTKHFTRSELADSVVAAGLTASRIRRVEYSWQSQGVRPGAKLRSRLPWDWIAIGRRATRLAS